MARSLQAAIDAIMAEVAREPIYSGNKRDGFAPVLLRNIAGAAVRALQNDGWELVDTTEGGSDDSQS
jgi:hypothetical protein